jgi:hypothetical protein
VKNCEPNKCDDLLWSRRPPKKTIAYVARVLELIEKKISNSYFVAKGS